MTSGPNQRLSKQLNLFDVFVIGTGAMFSSGFFLLPGIATSETGASVALAYLAAGLLMVPAMVSKAELATAMPKAGGTYYYLDRTLGPLVGTIGGFGTWLALVLKSAFALIGMGAYVSLYLDLPIKPLAIVCALALAGVNVVGTKEASRLIRVLVVVMLGLLVFFMLHGMFQIATVDSVPRTGPFLTRGVDGFIGTVGLVFVSFIGLTKVVSLAEEVEDPDRTVPLGMMLSLAAVTVIYVGGAWIMVSVLGVDVLSASLTPVADTAGALQNWVPQPVWVALMVTAAVAAFATMSNAGILAASRYPLAMARDRLVPDVFGVVSRFHTPIASIGLTAGVLVSALLVFDVEQVAKLASSMQLAIFMLINVAVIVMRESRIEAYDPGFRSPFYPWMQFAGVIVPMMLVAEMGWLSVLFTLGVILVGVGWYQYYGRDRIVREGAIFHVFARLGRRRFAGLDRELRDLMKEKGLRAEDPFDEVVARALVVDVADRVGLRQIIDDASHLLQGRVAVNAAHLVSAFTHGVEAGGTPVSRGAALLHTRLPDLDSSEVVLVRCQTEVDVDVGDDAMRRQVAESPVHAIFFVESSETDPGRHLRILAQLAGRVENGGFMEEWLANQDEQELKETLLRDDRFLALKLRTGSKSEAMIGHALRELSMPEGSLVALIRRYGVTMVPRGRTVLREGDRLTIIGDPAGLQKLDQEYGDGG